MREYFRYIKGASGNFGAIGVKEVEGGNFKVGISICAKCEPRFNKKLARELVNQKIEKSEEFTFFEMVDNKVLDKIKKTLPHFKKSDWYDPNTLQLCDIDVALRRISNDILMDYAKEYYNSIK